MNTIDQLSPGQEGIIDRLLLSGRQKQHMEDLGFLPGVPVRVLYRSPAGDPTAYDILGAVIALRRRDARHIQYHASLPEERSAQK